MNTPAIRAQPLVSFGGIGSASALAKFYSMLANGGKLDGQTFFSEETIAWMTTALADGMDRVFQIPTAFSAGFMKDPRNAAAKNVRYVTERIRTSGRGGRQRLCRSRKQDLVRLRHESNGTAGIAERKIAALGGCDLRVRTDSVTRFVSARPAVALYLFADDCDQYFSPVRCAAMFEEKNALPGSELHFSIDNGHRLAGARQDHANV